MQAALIKIISVYSYSQYIHNTLAACGAAQLSWFALTLIEAFTIHAAQSATHSIKMFRHKIFYCVNTLTLNISTLNNTHTQSHLCSWYLFTFCSIELHFHGKAEEEKRASAAKFFPAALGESFCHFRRHFEANCVWNWIAIVNNSLPKIFPKHSRNWFETSEQSEMRL